MAERIALEPEVQEILRHIDNGDDFLLSGGAGSWKTHSLVQLIGQLAKEKPHSNIACVTFTNAAVNEIRERVDSENLKVSTIHDFLWENVGHYQYELIDAIVSLVNNPDSRMDHPEWVQITKEHLSSIGEGIRYKEYVNLKAGVVSHDEVIELANHMFENHPKLCEIVQWKYQFIFVDEYQDTQKRVVEILLDYLRRHGKRTTVWFFWDSMQSIYDGGVWSLLWRVWTDPWKIREVKKSQNRRNPKSIIELANKLRTDGLVQAPSNDINAPNMTASGIIKDGRTLFLYSFSPDCDIDIIKNELWWDFSNSGETKILNLTHNLIAPNAWFSDLIAIYDKDPVIKLKSEIMAKIKSDPGHPAIIESDTFDTVVDKFQLNEKKAALLSDTENSILYSQLRNRPFSEVREMYLSKDSLLDDKKQNPDEEDKKGTKRDALTKHLFKIRELTSLYEQWLYNDFLRRTEFSIRTIADKQVLKDSMDRLSGSSWTIGEAIDLADELWICRIDDKLNAFIRKNYYLYHRVRGVALSQFKALYDYLEWYTPFSTQHKTKGAEFDNVLVILENGWWRNYNFTWLFEGTNTGTVKSRTEKLFYVCCTRTKENLALFIQNPSQTVISKAIQWFWSENVRSIGP